MSEGTTGQGFSHDRARRGFLGRWEPGRRGAKLRTTCSFGTKCLFSSITLRNLSMFHWTERSGGIGKFRQIVGALRPYGEQVKTPGRSSQMGRLR